MSEDTSAQGQLVFLSARHTTRGGLAVPDEAMPLAGELLHAGWQHVIGTFWAVDEKTVARPS